MPEVCQPLVGGVMHPWHLVPLRRSERCRPVLTATLSTWAPGASFAGAVWTQSDPKAFPQGKMSFSEGACPV